MKNYTAIIITLFLLFQSSLVLAWRHGKRPVTPYGDFHPNHNRYGYCKSTLTIEDAKKAITGYYNKKGLNAEIINIRGRFIKVKVKDKNNVVDIVIFDRRSGRIRSIY